MSDILKEWIFGNKKENKPIKDKRESSLSRHRKRIESKKEEE